MKNKKILYLLTIIITLFTFNQNVNAAQPLTCVYQKGINNKKVILVQEESGIKSIYTNEKDALQLDESWQYQNNYTYNFDKVTTELDSDGNLSSCPQYSELNVIGKDNPEVALYSTDAGQSEILDKQFLSSEVLRNTPSSNDSNITIKELTCVYKKGGATRKVVLTQDSDGTQTVYTNDSNEAINGVGWVTNKYVVNIFYESLNDYGYLDKCPAYANAPSSEDKVDFFDTVVLSDADTWLPEGLEDNGSYDEVKQIGNTIASTPDNKGDGPLIELNPDDSRYTGLCKYKKMLDSGKYHYVQINYGKSDVLITEYDPEKTDNTGKNYSGLDEFDNIYEPFGESNRMVRYIYSFKMDTGFTNSYFLKLNQGKCPIGIRVKRISEDYVDGPQRIIEINTKIIADTKSGDLYTIDLVGGTNPLNGELLTLDSVLKPVEFIKIEVENCKDLLGKDIAGYLNIIWNIIKIGVPIILIGFGTIDFVQAIFSGKEDGMKKAQEKFIKRIIIAVVIFLIPTVLTFLLNVANNVWGNIGTDICGIIF